ncbi:hypothetical protein D3C87_1977580 [compost metagenome]
MRLSRKPESNTSDSGKMMNSAEARPANFGLATLFRYGRIRPYKTSPTSKLAELLDMFDAGTVPRIALV